MQINKSKLLNFTQLDILIILLSVLPLSFATFRLLNSRINILFVVYNNMIVINPHAFGAKI